MVIQNQPVKRPTHKARANLIILCTILFPLSSLGNDYVYLSDQVSIPLREGPAPDDKILKRKIISGTKLRLLESQSERNYTKVQTSKGEIGWLPAEYLVSEPPAKIVLAEQYEISAQLQSRLDEETKNSENSREQLLELENQKNEKEKKINALETELQAIKILSAQTIDINQNNLILEQTNQRLRESIKQMTIQNQISEEKKRYLDFLIGGGLVLVGFLMGFLIKSKRRQSGWSS